MLGVSDQVIALMEDILKSASENYESYQQMLKLSRTLVDSVNNDLVEIIQEALTKRTELITSIEEENTKIQEGQRQICSILNVNDFDIVIANHIGPVLSQHWTDIYDRTRITIEGILALDRQIAELLDMQKNNMELNLHRLRKVSQMSESYQSLNMARARFLDQRK
jgi:hypothetical protein